MGRAGGRGWLGGREARDGGGRGGMLLTPVVGGVREARGGWRKG